MRLGALGGVSTGRDSNGTGRASNGTRRPSNGTRPELSCCGCGALPEPLRGFLRNGSLSCAPP
jgi:hypothetical protein